MNEYFDAPENTGGTGYETIIKEGEIPETIKERVVYYAVQYKNADTDYKYGAQDPLYSIKVDCSGLVIRCYKYALQNTGYELLLSDMSSSYMYTDASYHTDNPEPGDLVFMGEENSSTINHVGIFTKRIGDKIYFIDSTDYYGGVTERSLSRTSKKIKGFGEMKLKQSSL